MPSSRPSFPVALTVALVVALAFACGAPDAPVQTEEARPSEVLPQPARGPAGLAGVTQRGRLRIAADPDAPPFLARVESGFEGFEYAIMQSIADRADVSVEIVEAKFDELPGKVVSGEADLAIGQLSPSSSYEGLAWSVSYLQYSLCLVVPKGSTVKALPDLKGKRVAMYDDPVARQLTDVLIGATYDRQEFDDYGYFEKMARGQIDAMVYDCPLARYEMKVYGDSLQIVDDGLNVTTYNVAMRANDKVMLQDVNDVLKELGNNGLLETLQARWMGDVVRSDDFSTATGEVAVVKKGDTLGIIAERKLGTSQRWQEIYDKNVDVVGPDPDVIYSGMRLRIPKQ
jgi:ABC-type amino acid transport substrate-binding protein